MTLPLNYLPYSNLKPSHENCLPTTPKFTSTVLAVERTVLAEDSSDGSFQGSPSILSRKKKRSKIASTSILMLKILILQAQRRWKKPMQKTNFVKVEITSRNR